MRKVIIFLFLMHCAHTVWLKAQSREMIAREDYIEAYSELAIKEMERSGVPASITLAQGMLESDNGNSRLAVEGNNHFGIKCHDDWKGRTIYHDDDHKKECFRKYKSVVESYKDHSEFLRNRSRYAYLFELDPTDYKGWAKGLKKAGYATSHTYADKLIRIIEENDLHKFDLVSGMVSKSGRKAIRPLGEARTDGARAIYKRNRIDFIIVREGDTYESLQKEFGLMPFELFRYNNLTRDSVLYPGRELYLQPKRNKAEAGKPVHIVEEGETLYDISQMYGVKPGKILEMNLMSAGDEPVTGQKLSLRKKIVRAGDMEEASPQKSLIKRTVKDAGEVEKTGEGEVEKAKQGEKRKRKIKVREEKEKDTIEFEFN